VRVRGVVTKQGTDISERLNQVAGDYADAFTGVLIAESNLNEQALREGQWPDYSAGLSQVIAANLGYGTYQREATPEEKAEYRELMFVPTNAILVGWKYYEAALRRMDYDPLWAALSYNRGPSYTLAQLVEQVKTLPSIRSRFERYKASLEQAREYAMAATVGQGIKDKMDAAGDEPITNEWVEDMGGAKVAKAYGRKGLYVASDDSGQWVTAGPFPGAAG
jgi:Transglycosylase SLT domain